MSFALEWKQRAYDKRKKIIAAAKITSGCVDCGVWGPDEILSFDHVRGEKLFNIGSRWDVSSTKLEAEIAKCEVVCHNCHALRTTRRIKKNSGPVFESFPKIPRLNRPCIITEKIDGSNGTIWIDGDGDVWAGSKNRWITSEEDNFGFAAWVELHADGLRESLGEGAHRGEWWGSGIQRGYGLQKGEKRFSLFNVSRYLIGENAKPQLFDLVPGLGCVPILYEGPFTTDVVKEQVEYLRVHGSQAVYGYMRPEGVITFHVAANMVFKTTLEADEKPKGSNE